MHVQLDAGALAAAVKWCLPFTDRHSRNMPILAAMKLIAFEGRLEIEATDLDVAVRRVVDGVTVHTAGSFVVDAAMLAKAAGGLDGTVELREVGGFLRVQAQRRTVRLHPHVLADWPIIPALHPVDHERMKLTPWAKVYTHELARLLEAPLGCILTPAQAELRDRRPMEGLTEKHLRETRALQRMLLHFDGARLNAYGCNGVAMVHASLPSRHTFADALVAPSAVRHTAKVLQKSTSSVVYLDEVVVDTTRYLVIQGDDFAILLRANPGQACEYPNTDRVWPTTSRASIDVRVDNLVTAAKWLHDMSTDAVTALLQLVPGSVGGNKDTLFVRVDDSGGEMSTSVDVEVIKRTDNQPVEMRMHVELILMACKAVCCTPVRIDISTEDRAVVFSDFEPEYLQIRAAVMPCKLNP